MQFITTALLPIMAVLATTAYAADCSTKSGAPNCLTRDEAFYLRDMYCTNDYYKNGVKMELGGTNGRGTIIATGGPTQQDCWDSSADILNQCYGNRNGGTFSEDGWNMNMNFCIS